MLFVGWCFLSFLLLFVVAYCLLFVVRLLLLLLTGLRQRFPLGVIFKDSERFPFVSKGRAPQNNIC